MPRGARLDAPGTLHHVIVRGIERGAIFNDDEDRKVFLNGVLGTLFNKKRICCLFLYCFLYSIS
jgi:hypothetical protein